MADDWLCTNARPVTDIHWWGSFLTWTGTNLPPQIPVGYHFAIWTDVPTNANNLFSHPGRVLWDYVASTTDPNLKGHWVGWDLDPRNPCLAPESCFKFDYPLPNASWYSQPIVSRVFKETGLNRKLEIALELERIALSDEYFIKRKLYPNVDFYSGLIYQALHFPVDMFPVLFAIGRTSGWLAQWQELLLDPEQKIARPRQVYLGSDKRDVVMLSQRK